MESNPQRPQFVDGSRVLGADGRAIGEVVATYREHLIVERGYFFPTNYYIPFSAVANAGGGDVVLALSGQEALAQGWETPPADPVTPPATTLPAPPPDPNFPAASATGRPRRPVAAPPDPSVAAAPDVPASGVDLPEAPAAAAAAASALTTMPAGAESAVSSTTSPAPEAPPEPAPVPDIPTTAAPDVAGQPDRSETVVDDAGTPGMAETLGPPPVVEPVTATRADTAPVETAPAPAGPIAPAEDPIFSPSVDDTMGAASGPAPSEEVQADAVTETPAGPAPVAAAPPPFVGIPGRRLTDAELWSLLDPKESETPEATADEESSAGNGSDDPSPGVKPEP